MRDGDSADQDMRRLLTVLQSDGDRGLGKAGELGRRVTSTRNWAGITRVVNIPTGALITGKKGSIHEVTTI